MNLAGKRLIPVSTYTRTVGTFGPMMEGKPAWHHCREVFHNRIGNRRDFFYFTSSAETLASFIYRVEEHFGIEKSCFEYTDRPDVVWANVSPWWACQPMRYQFLSCCFRAANSSADWMGVLRKYTYFKSTPDAFNRFLAGNTHYTGVAIGWHAQFTGAVIGRLLRPDELETLLIPEEEGIKRVAYFRWTKAGRPSDQGDRFWNEAKKELGR